VATGASTSATCSASSRVGTSTRPRWPNAGSPLTCGQHRHAEASVLSRAGLGPAATSRP
jgi:hypothetical protein